jgi:hypothetical protein
MYVNDLEEIKRVLRAPEEILGFTALADMLTGYDEYVSNKFSSALPTYCVEKQKAFLAGRVRYGRIAVCMQIHTYPSLPSNMSRIMFSHMLVLSIN